MAETGLCEHGEQEKLIQSGATELDGRLPINTDGGCLANGEPIGASGLRQVHEVVLQLRGDAGDRQVPGPRASASPRSTARRASAPAPCSRSEEGERCRPTNWWSGSRRPSCATSRSPSRGPERS